MATSSQPLLMRATPRLPCRFVPALGGICVVADTMRGHVFAPHLHSDIEIFVGSGSSIAARCGHDQITVTAADIVIVGPGAVHTFGPSSGAPWRLSALHVPLASLDSGSDISALEGSHATMTDPELAELLRGGVGRLMKDGDDGDIARLVDVVLSRVRQLEIRGVAVPPANSRSAVERAREFIDAHVTDSIYLSDLAELAHLSQYHFIRAFTATVGLTPYAYFIQQRVSRAQELLAGGVPAVAVAARCGFSDQSHLSRHFKRVLGVTPTQYRTAALELHGDDDAVTME